MSESPTLPGLDPGAVLASLRERLHVPDDERRFREAFIEQTLPATRIGMMLALAVVVAVCVLDWALMPSGFAADTIPFRMAAMLLPLAFAVATSFVASARNLLPYVTGTAAVLVGIATIVVGTTAARTGTGFAFWGTIITTIGVYLVLGLRLRQSVAAGWLIFLAYCLIGLLAGASVQHFTYGGLFLVVANLAGMYASYRHEWSARHIHAQARELRRLARTDGLSGVANRSTFDEHLTSVWRQARRDDATVAVVLVDIDFFRLYNDCYGHQEGDACLRAVARVLADSINRPLDLVARYSGGQFAMLLYDPSQQFVETFVRELCSRVFALEIPHKGSDVAATVTVSIGAALVEPREGDAADQILRSADDSLYEAKDRGRNQAIVYRPEWADASSMRLPAIAL